MAEEGGLDMLITLLGSTSDLVQRQAAKALANLGVNSASSGLTPSPTLLTRALLPAVATALLAW